MFSLIKIKTSTNTKKCLFHVLFFSIAVFICCSVVFSVFHNDDVKHEIHPINHSPVCQWLHEGKLCNSSVTDLSLNFFPFISVIATLLLFTPCFLLLGKHKEKKDPLNFLFLSSTHPSRAPPVI